MYHIFPIKAGKVNLDLTFESSLSPAGVCVYYLDADNPAVLSQLNGKQINEVSKGTVKIFKKLFRGQRVIMSAFRGGHIDWGLYTTNSFINHLVRALPKNEFTHFNSLSAHENIKNFHYLIWDVPA